MPQLDSNLIPKPLADPAATNLDRAFFVSLYIKAATGVIQLAGGIALLFLKPSRINSWQHSIAKHLVDRDRDDVIFRAISTYFMHLTGGAVRFAAIYLIVDAIIKLALINEIFHKRYWAYLGLIGVLSALVIYQTYRLSLHLSLPLLVLTLFDVVIILLSSKEYLRHKRSVAASKTT